MFAILDWAVSKAATLKKRSPLCKWSHTRWGSRLVRELFCVSVFLMTLEDTAQEMCSVNSSALMLSNTLLDR
jgi:hypothetical protein